MILVNSHGDDVHARRVIEALNRLGAEVLLFDAGRFPERMTLTLSNRRAGGLAALVRDSAADSVDLRRAGAVWWRRPQPLTVSTSVVDPEHRRFTLNEASEALAGLWEVLDVFWVNHPARDAAAHRKLLQLQAAEQVGLRCPRTLITSDPDEARRFIEENAPAPTIYKAFSATLTRWRETRVVRPEELALLPSVRHCPVIFQEYVPAASDLRVTIVDGRIFVAEIKIPEDGYAYDYRMDLARCPMAASRLAPSTEERLRNLLSRLGLVYGAVDLRRTPDGEEVFLEVNPAGQWLFAEERTGLPITETLASVLAERDRTRSRARRPSRSPDLRISAESRLRHRAHVRSP